LLRAMHGPKLLRVKGLVALADDPTQPVVVHGVQHVFHPPLRLASWPNGDDRTRMVFIVQDVSREAIEALWGALTGAPAVDRPDATALARNPLRPGAAGLLS
jgi:G3E family GTPase